MGLALLLGLALGLRLWGLGYPLWYDEGFHILAARSLLRDGTLCVADCLQPYGRGAIFSWLVAGSFAILGESPVAARIPSVLAGILLVAAVFIWVRREFSNRAAWVAAGLCAIGPELVGWSQVSRFYAAQALLVWCGVTLFFSGLRAKDLRARAAALGVSAACLLVSIELQISTLIPMAALGLWFVGWLVSQRSRVSRRTQAALGVAGLALGAAAAIGLWPTLATTWSGYRGGTNLMLAGDAGNPFFYHSWFVRMYSYFYALLPIGILITGAIRPAPTLLLTVTFAVSFVAHSFGGFKADRFVLYTFPFFFTIWGVALAEVVPKLTRYAQGAIGSLLPVPGSRARHLGAAATVTAALIFAALNTEALQTTVRIVTVSNTEWNGEPWYRGHTDWEAVRPSVESLVQEVDLVVSSAQLKTIYYFGRTDVSLSRTQLYRPGADDRNWFLPEFWQDPNTGKHVVSTPASVRRLVSCYPSGLFLIETGHWRSPSAVTPEVADVIERLAEEVAVPGGMRARAFVWQTLPAAMAGDCELARS